MSAGIVPNLIHPVDVTIEQINRAATIYDDDAREPVQAAARKSQVVVPGQPRWGSSRRLEATAGGPVDNATGYVLFRPIDLEAAGVDLQINDRLRFQGRELYIVRLQPAGHYGGVSKLTRAYFADREPAKKPEVIVAAGPTPISPDEVGGLKVWLESTSGIELFTIPGYLDRVRRWVNMGDLGTAGNFENTQATRAPIATGDTPPAIRFDATAAKEYLGGPNLLDLFGSLPLSVFIVASCASTPSPLLSQQPSGGNPLLSMTDTSAAYRGPAGALSFPQNTVRAVRSLHVDGAGDYYYREDGVELDRANKSLGPHADSLSNLGAENRVVGPWLTGDFFALLMYSRSTGLTEAEITGLDAYLTEEFL